MLFWNLAHGEDVSTEIIDQALSAHVKILDYSCAQVIILFYNIVWYQLFILMLLLIRTVMHKKQLGLTNVLMNLKIIVHGYFQF